jgi:hypothetical protein
MKILSEPKVVPSFRGLVPVVDTDQGTLYIAAKSLMEPMLYLVQLNGGKWTGIEAEITKVSTDRMAPYQVSHPALSTGVPKVDLSTAPKNALSVKTT